MATGFVRCHLPRFKNQDTQRQIKLSVDLQEPHAGVLEQMEDASAEAAPTRGYLYSSAYSLLRHRPALGILLAGALLTWNESWTQRRS